VNCWFGSPTRERCISSRADAAAADAAAYGGLPLKVLWAPFDLVTIVVLASGLYLWLSRRSAIAESEPAESHAGALARSTPGAAG